MTDTTVVADTEAPEAPQLEAAQAEPTPDDVPPAPVVPVPPVVAAPAPRTGNSAWPSEDERDKVKQFMDALRDAGYTRPELRAITGFNDSTVWRAQNAKVHTHEVDRWMDLVFKPFASGELLKTNPPAASLKAPKPEVLQAKLDAVQAKLDAVDTRVASAIEALSNPDVKTVKDLRALVEATQATLLGDASA